MVHGNESGDVMEEEVEITKCTELAVNIICTRNSLNGAQPGQQVLLCDSLKEQDFSTPWKNGSVGEGGRGGKRGEG